MENDLRYYPVNLKLEDVKNRTVGYYGLSLRGEILTLITVGLDYALNILKKVNKIAEYFLLLRSIMFNLYFC